MERMYSSLIVLLFCLCDISLIEGFGFSVDLIHRDSPQSPFYIPSETHFERVSKAIHRSINYANHFNNPSFSLKNIKSDVIANKGDYLMSYSIGTPPVKILGIADTGSDVIWLQCQPCDPCSPQSTPIFDPSNSTTYQKIPCTSAACKSAKRSTCSSQRTCQYEIGYGDGSQSSGDLSLETLTLGSTTGPAVSFPKTVIGCGTSNSVGDQGAGSGIVGLGNGPVSFITQLGSSIQGKFSYCLGPSLLKNPAPSKLSFGEDAAVSGAGTVTTPLFVDEIFYFLTLEAFSVGDKRVEFGRSSSSSSAKGNIIIDSGTTLTLLPKSVYTELESTVAAAITSKRVRSPISQLSLCYAASQGDKLEVPVITAHFTGADIKLNPLNTFFQVTEDTVCFSFAPTNQRVSIFGNLAHQNFLTGYDLKKKTLSFKPTDCTKQ